MFKVSRAEAESMPHPILCKSVIIYVNNMPLLPIMYSFGSL